MTVLGIISINFYPTINANTALLRLEIINPQNGVTTYKTVRIYDQDVLLELRNKIRVDTVPSSTTGFTITMPDKWWKNLSDSAKDHISTADSNQIDQIKHIFTRPKMIKKVKTKSTEIGLGTRKLDL